MQQIDDNAHSAYVGQPSTKGETFKGMCQTLRNKKSK